MMVCYAFTASRGRHLFKKPETVKKQNRAMGSLLIGAGLFPASAKRTG